MLEDEGKRHQAFEDACDGPTKAFRLMRIWESCANPFGHPFPLTEKEKAAKRLENFKRKAKQERYTDKQISMFLNL